MGFEASEKVVELNARLQAFMEEHIYPREHDWDEDSRHVGARAAHKATQGVS